MLNLGDYSFGIGDRFGHQGLAQLRAFQKALAHGIHLVPVWNKSYLEHSTIHSEPASVRQEATNAIRALGWEYPYHVDADHITLQTVDLFLESSDFFTIDVADSIGKPSGTKETEEFIRRNTKYLGNLEIPGIQSAYPVTKDLLLSIAARFLAATKEASKIYRHIAEQKGAGNFIAEVSMDEVDQPQSHIELFFILESLAHFGVAVQTIAPRFSGRFNKGVDYEGNLDVFGREFEQDLMVIDHAIREFGLPENLKLSIHSGSDKFSIYPIIARMTKKHGKGFHIKTAGTTWLEELIGLATAEGEALRIAKEIYIKAFGRARELCAPYASVIAIDQAKLPNPMEVNRWTGEHFAATLRHIPEESRYNPHFRQLLHVGYKIAAEMGEQFNKLLEQHQETIGKQVTENLFDRHIARLFPL